MERKDVYVLYSGGKDSGVLLHWAYKQKIPNFKGALAIDTTIHTPDWKNFIQENCDRNGYDLKIITRKDKKTFEDCSLFFGFGGPPAHNMIMRYLKMDPLRSLEKDNRQDNMLLLSGIRLDESDRRFGTVKPISKDVAWFNAPLYNWSNEYVMKYVEENRIQRSPSYETLHISGDCLCGCYAEAGEFDMIKTFYPDIARRIEVLQEKVREAGKKYYLWGNDEKAKKLRKEIKMCKKTGKPADSMVCGECSMNRASIG